jgi:uncharacterized membrane protein
MAHTYAPFSGLADLAGEPAPETNVGDIERIGSAVAGAALLSYGLARRDLTGALLGIVGGMFLYRGATGKCEAYRQLGIDTTGATDGRGVPGEVGVRVEKSIEIAKSPHELYHFWHDLTNLPGIMPHLKSVTTQGARSHWVVEGPAGHDVEWDAEFINDKPGEMIAWQSLPGAEVRNAGSVHFESVNGGDVTRVKVAIEYLPPGGKAGAFIAQIFGSSPEQQLDSDLARFKEKMESGS